MAAAVTVTVSVPAPAVERRPAYFPDLLGQAVGLRLDAVTREFGDRDVRTTALAEVSLEIGPGEFVSVVGPSGCGKTTLLSLIGGLDQPTSGHVYAAGLPLDQLPEADLADYRLQRVGTIFQTFNLVPSMTVEDNVALPLALAGVEPGERRSRARRLLELVGLSGRARSRVNRLSGGEQQKVAVARALANRPGLILADEPSGSLDSSAGEVILGLLEELNRRGATVLLVTHDPQVARRAHRVVRMIDGRAIEVGVGGRNVRNQDPVDPPTRLHWRDTLLMGLATSGRRPLRTVLTTAGVAIGIAAMSLIVAVAGGLATALSSPALARSQLHQVAVLPAADAGNKAFDAPTLDILSNLPHVTDSWGEVALSGKFSVDSAPDVTSGGALVSLPPLASMGSPPTLTYGRLPRTDSSGEFLLTDATAIALGFAYPASALGKTIDFSAAGGGLALPGSASEPVPKALTLKLKVIGIVASQAMPAGAAGGLAPYAVTDAYWKSVAKVSSWKEGEFMGVTLLADSGATVDGLRDRVKALGFQAQTFGDQFRGFEQLLGRLQVALLGLAVVALLLAGLGIANTMYTAELERTKEVGVLKAVGARSRDVLLLFVAEAAVIGLVGGVLGALVAVVLARLGNVAVDYLAQGTVGGGLDVFRQDLLAAVGAIALAIVLSTASGLLPALRAARQDPVTALRYE